MSTRHWKDRLHRLDQANLVRTLRPLSPRGPSTARGEDRDVLVACSNDYLGMRMHPEVVRAACAAARTYGVGSGASRLVSGDAPSHHELEDLVADLLGKPAAVLYPSGYQANVGALSALTQEGDVVFSDARNHASIIDGCRLSKARVHVYPHGDVAALDAALAATPCAGVKLVVTESIFSMDGDCAPLRDLCAVARRHGTLVYVDEAHAFGVLGPQGRGACWDQQVADMVDVIVVTFGKAVGTAGAAVACGPEAAALQRSRARSLLYTTAPPPAVAAATATSLRILTGPQGDAARRRLWDNREALWQYLRAARITGAVDTGFPIIPLIVGDPQAALALSAALWRNGVFAQAIRPPTVPEGTSRIRLTVTAAFTAADIERLAAAVSSALNQEKP